MDGGRPGPAYGVGERKFHEDPRLDAAVREMATAIAWNGRGPDRQPPSNGRSLMREVATERGVFMVRATRVRPAPSAADLLVVTVIEPRQRDLPPDAEIVSQLGLTRTEARVARLLAAGRTNMEIAEALFISAHTARHHTESVLLKLGVHSRREVAGVLRRSVPAEFAA